MSDQHIRLMIWTCDIHNNDGYISNFIYEYIMLLLPYKRVHPEGEDLCDQEVVDKLNQHTQNESDPRWAALKELKNNTD